MDIKGKVILHCAQYASPYRSNFIESLENLEKVLKSDGTTMVYVFPASITIQSWWSVFSAKHLCYTTTDNVDYSDNDLLSILRLVRPSLVHTHFDGYDIPLRKAIDKYGECPKIVWHLHDSLWFQRNPIKALYQCYCYFRHYNYYTRDTSVIAVNQKLLDFVSRFKRITGSSFDHSLCLLNGVDENRLSPSLFYQAHSPFTFFAFGSRNIQKRIDLLVQAALKVRNNQEIELLITEGVDTREVVNVLFKGSIPKWCRLVPQTDDISSLFSQADCFVSCSSFEGFSYAICEAEMFGLPVIQSNIVGTKWNENNPSVLTFESGNIDDLAKTMEQMIVNCNDQSFSINNKIRDTRKIVVNNYSIEKWVEKVISFYRSL